MKRWAIILTFATLLPSGAFPGDERTVHLASDRWPPFTNVKGESRLAIDLVHQALKRMGVRDETTVTDWKNVLAGLRDGRFDGSAAIWRSEEREAFLLYSEPYLENRLVLVGNRNSDVGAKRLADLAGKRVGVVDQYAYGGTVDGAEGPRFVAGTSDQENLQKLLAGEIDYMLVDELLIRYVVEREKEEAARLLAIGDTPLVQRTLHFALRRELPDAARLIEAFNTEIAEMLADGTYNIILRLDWIRADVDGDGQPELVARGKQAGEVAPTTGYSILSTIPSESPVKLTQPQRFWVDGQAYESWDAVPARYKTKPPSDADKAPPALLRF